MIYRAGILVDAWNYSELISVANDKTYEGIVSTLKYILGE